MALELFPPEPEDLPELGRICYRAFESIARPHGFEPDFSDFETAILAVQMISRLPGGFSVAARLDGRLVGSNFLLASDNIAGVGPITVDPAEHSRGIGRKLMQAVLDHATARGLERVRLMQDSYNSASLSLYASLGFDVRETVGLLRAGPAGAVDPTVRPATPADLDALAQLCVTHYRVNRRGELGMWIHLGLPVLVREVDGRLRSYLVAGKLGHGVSESEDDALALIGQIGRFAPPGMDVWFCPLRETSLFRGALRAGGRLLKIMTLMTRGPYEDPAPVWMPSVAF